MCCSTVGQLQCCCEYRVAPWPLSLKMHPHVQWGNTTSPHVNRTTSSSCRRQVVPTSHAAAVEICGLGPEAATSEDNTARTHIDHFISYESAQQQLHSVSACCILGLPEDDLIDTCTSTLCSSFPMKVLRWISGVSKAAVHALRAATTKHPILLYQDQDRSREPARKMTSNSPVEKMRCDYRQSVAR